MITIKVPATSANLGAGFDSMGVALTLYNEVQMAESDRIEIRAKDGVNIPTDQHNMIYVAAKELYQICGKPLRGLRIEQTSNIPMTRGLGSSSACLIAGLWGANHLLGNPMGEKELIDLAAKEEGHPDNVVPAATGGFITAVMEDGHIYYKRQDVSADVAFAVMIPPFRLSTKHAREILPASYSRQDAVYNISRAALFASSFPQGDFAGMEAAQGDRIHEPYRLQLIEGGKEAYQAAQEAGGVFVYLSGAGPTLVSVYRSNDIDYMKRLERNLYQQGITGWRLLSLQCDSAGAVIEEGDF